MLDTNSEIIPGWLSAILTEKFFNACIIHEDAKKNEKNVFCLDCCEGICPHCLPNHRSHRLLQIRRYVYQDVIRLVDADKLMDCAQVQCYTSNSAKVVFLHQRPQQTTRAPRATSNLCITCDRNLHESFLYCSLSCKLRHILGSGCNLSLYLRKCEFLDFPEPGLDDELMTPDSVLEPSGSVRTESGSSSFGAAGLVEHPNLNCTATTEVVKKKRSDKPGCSTGFGPVSEVSESECMMNRRKGTPQRSPFN